MSNRINKVVASPTGQIFRNKAKNIGRPPRREKFNRKEQPVSVSDEIEDAGVFRGARVMKSTTEKKVVSFRHGEYKSTDESPNPRYDSRCHPHWKKK